MLRPALDTAEVLHGAVLENMSRLVRATRRKWDYLTNLPHGFKTGGQKS